jgi:UDP-N-acetyl-D-mannosaminuronic acid dehydrogenase
VSSEENKVVVFGLGFVGLPFGLLLAERGLEILGVDPNPKVIGFLNQATPHFYETGLQELLQKHIGKSFRVQPSLGERFGCTYIVTVGTPIDNMKADLSAITQVSEAIAAVIAKGDLVILRSTVPVGTTRSLVVPILERSGLNAESDFSVVFAPERVVQGASLEELSGLPQIIGAITSAGAAKAEKFFSAIAKQIRIVESIEAAELIKLANNSFRDVTFGFSNELANLCDVLNLDPETVIAAANENYPRSHIPMPSPGVGGYCLTKDPYILLYDALINNVDMPVIRSARTVNEEMPLRVARKVERFFAAARNESVEGKRIAILGLAFKGRPATSDMRFSPSLEVADFLRNKGANVIGHDFHTGKNKLTPLPFEEAASIADALQDADAVLVMTNNREYGGEEMLKCLDRLNTPALIFDPWNLLGSQRHKTGAKLYYANMGYSNF